MLYIFFMGHHRRQIFECTATGSTHRSVLREHMSSNGRSVTCSKFQNMLSGIVFAQASHAIARFDMIESDCRETIAVVDPSSTVKDLGTWQLPFFHCQMMSPLILFYDRIDSGTPSHITKSNVQFSGCDVDMVIWINVRNPSAQQGFYLYPYCRPFNLEGIRYLQSFDLSGFSR